MSRIHDMDEYTTEEVRAGHFRLPAWTHRLVPMTLALLLLLGGSVIAALAYYGTEDHWNVGYSPKQPIDFSHKLHAGDLATDCRYCHYSVDTAAFAALPPTQICFNCHGKLLTDSPKLLRLVASLVKKTGIAWVRVHKLADHVHFDHGAHLSAGVGCSTCHGRVDQMDVVRQTEPLSMGWCLDCHRNPTLSIRHQTDITNMSWDGRKSAAPRRLMAPPTHCTGCHR